MPWREMQSNESPPLSATQLAVDVQAEASDKVNIGPVLVCMDAKQKNHLTHHKTHQSMNFIRNNTPSLFLLVFVVFPFVLQGQVASPWKLKYDFAKYVETISDDEFHALFFDTLGNIDFGEMAALENSIRFCWPCWMTLQTRPARNRQISMYEESIKWGTRVDVVENENNFSVWDSTGQYVVSYYRVVFNPRKIAKYCNAVNEYFDWYSKKEELLIIGIDKESEQFKRIEKKLNEAEKLAKKYLANYQLPIRKWNTTPPAWMNEVSY